MIFGTVVSDWNVLKFLSVPAALPCQWLGYVTTDPNAKYFTATRHSLFTGTSSFSGPRFSMLLEHLCISLPAQRHFQVSITGICISATALLHCQYAANKNKGQQPV